MRYRHRLCSGSHILNAMTLRMHKLAASRATCSPQARTQPWAPQRHIPRPSRQVRARSWRLHDAPWPHARASLSAARPETPDHVDSASPAPTLRRKRFIAGGRLRHIDERLAAPIGRVQVETTRGDQHPRRLDGSGARRAEEGRGALVVERLLMCVPYNTKASPKPHSHLTNASPTPPRLANKAQTPQQHLIETSPTPH